MSGNLSPIIGSSTAKPEFLYSLINNVDGSAVLIKKRDGDLKTIKVFDANKNQLLKLAFGPGNPAPGDLEAMLDNPNELLADLNRRITAGGGQPLLSTIPSIAECAESMERLLNEFQKIFPTLIEHFNEPKRPKEADLRLALFRAITEELQLPTVPGENRIPEDSRKRKREVEEREAEAEEAAKKVTTLSENPEGYQEVAKYHVRRKPLLAFAEYLNACRLILRDHAQPRNPQLLLNILDSVFSLDPGELIKAADKQPARAGEESNDGIIEFSLFSIYRIALAIRHHHNDQSSFSAPYILLDAQKCKKTAANFYKTLIAIEPDNIEALERLIAISKPEQQRHLWFSMAAQYLANGNLEQVNHCFRQASDPKTPFGWNEHILCLADGQQRGKDVYKARLQRAAEQCPKEKIKILKLRLEIEEDPILQEGIITEMVAEYRARPGKGKQLLEWQESLLERYQRYSPLPLEKVVPLIENMVELATYPRNTELLTQLRDFYYCQNLEIPDKPYQEKLMQTCEQLGRIYRENEDAEGEQAIRRWTLEYCPTPNLLRDMAASLSKRGDEGDEEESSQLEVKAALLEKTPAGYAAINETISKLLTRSERELEELPTKLSSSADNRHIIDILREQQSTMKLLAHEIELIARAPVATPVAVSLPLPVKPVETIEKLFPQMISPIFGKAEWQALLPEVEMLWDEPSLPPDLEEIWDTPCPFFKGKKIRETHILVWIPNALDGERMTLKRFKETLERKKRIGYAPIKQADLNEYAGSTIKRSHWVLLTQNIIPGTRAQSYPNQARFIESHQYLLPEYMLPAGSKEQKQYESYKVPTALEVSITSFIAANQHVYLYGSQPVTYTRCLESLYDIHWMVGNFDSHSGLQLMLTPPTDTKVRRQDRVEQNLPTIGMAAVRRF